MRGTCERFAVAAVLLAGTVSAADLLAVVTDTKALTQGVRPRENDRFFET
jgi:hypothetical protein